MDENKNNQLQNQVPSPQQSFQPPAIVNGQPFTPSEPLVNQIGDDTAKKPSKWKYFFITLGILQILGIALFLLGMFTAAEQAEQGAAGTEFIALALFATVVPAVAIISVINLVGLTMYLIKNKNRGKSRIIGILSIGISAVLVAYGLYTVYGLYMYPKQLSEQLDKKYEEKEKAFAADNAKPEITKDEAITLLKTCQLSGFYYTNQTDKSNPANGGWGELSTTGVVLTKVEGKPYRISIADKLIPELVPIAREAQKTCTNPQFWHDGNYEHYTNGKWYFNNEVVNVIQEVTTENDIITALDECKVDYFVGYTAINLVKDENTKSWLDNAEKSDEGVAMSESSSKTYVFVSKAKTTELQDDAKMFRDTCYDKKKLYIVVDNTIETEYPIGQWTKIEQ